MTRSERESLQKRIVHYYVNVAGQKKNVTVHHFLQEKVHRQTIYSIIKKYEECCQVGDKPRSDRPKEMNQKQVNRLKKVADHQTGISLRILASKFRVCHQTICNYLKEMNIKYYEKQRAPKYTDNQIEEVPTRARRLCRLLTNNDFELVMDDEKYFLLADQSVPTNRGFYSSDRKVTKPDVKFKQSQKYKSEILVWIAFSTDGVSSPFSCETKASHQ